ncbi:Hypothetical_protein [Hexamita inflata]|uniref:Hypothetical_protein n=1 Tax=Hexamita inflata TaxID=28002 RepID=A0AA86P3M1_9EUKA|nr:Hypothetical protein HINF_LOCUS17813 [Hexamita inflata]CAI9935655.1 Hypothetical protein HINF_LOCUS23300 [Hexamita inflata]
MSQEQMSQTEEEKTSTEVVHRNIFSNNVQKLLDQSLIDIMCSIFSVNTKEQLFDLYMQLVSQQVKIKWTNIKKLFADKNRGMVFFPRYTQKRFQVLLENYLQPYPDELKANVVQCIEKNIKAQQKEIKQFNQKQLSKYQSDFIKQVKLQFSINPARPYKYKQMSDKIMNTVKYYTKCIRLAQISNDTDSPVQAPSFCQLLDRELSE